MIRATSVAIRRLLWDEVSSELETAAIVPTEAAIVLTNPTDTRQDSANRLSLWLYHVTEDEHLKNRPMLRHESPGPPGPIVVSQFPPLALRFYYLITPFGRTGEEDHLLLGKIMQVAYDNAIVVLRDPSIDVAEELRIALYRNTLEEQTRIWDALNEPYRLSISYQVKVAQIDSQRIPSGARVIERGAFLPDREAVGA